MVVIEIVRLANAFLVGKVNFASYHALKDHMVLVVARDVIVTVVHVIQLVENVFVNQEFMVAMMIVLQVCNCFNAIFQIVFLISLCNCFFLGFYGPKCELPCRMTSCSDNRCDKTFGDCICPYGFFGENCNQPCPLFSYGKNCRHSCKCSREGTENCNSQVNLKLYLISFRIIFKDVYK